MALIRHRFVLVGVILVTIIIGAAGLIIEMQRLASIDAFRTATVNLANGMAQQTTRSFATIDLALQEIQTELASSADATPDGIAVAMSSKSGSLADRRKQLSGVDSLLLIDASGHVAATTRAWQPTETEVSVRDVFSHLAASDDHAAFVGTPVKNGASGRWTALMARRLDGADGRFAGVVAGEISLTDILAFFQLAMPVHRSVYLVRRDGVILVRYPERDGEIGKKIPDRSPWYATLAVANGTYHAAGFFEPGELIAAARPLRGLPFVVEASVSDADALSDWYRQRIWVGLGTVSAVVCALSLLRLFAGQYGRLAASQRALTTKNAELDNAHRQLNATLASLIQGVCFFDSDYNLLVCNKRYEKIYGLPDGALQRGMPLREIALLRIAAGNFVPGTVEEYLATIHEIIRRGGTDDTVWELTDGRTIAGHIEVLPGRGYVVTAEDITERRQAEGKIAFLARHDVLTGLANRTLFHEQIGQALVQAARGKGFALHCLDLDRFKAVNDTCGHPVGDSLLRAVADRLRDAVRDGDCIARLGGDEFAILQFDVTEVPEVTVLARRIVASLSEPFDLDGNHVSVGTSIGIAMAPGDSSDAGHLMKDADLALYCSKQEGRGTWRFFDAAMHATATARSELESDLRCVLERGQLELHYQPLVCSLDRSLTGFEALLRWHHPTRGLVLPGEFVSVAEEIGLIAEIGNWVLRQACAEAATWPDHLRVAVNLSTRQFRGQALVGIVTDAIRASGLAPARLELEITESVPLQQDQATLSILHDLHALGARIALDDFGTGYSSLSYLRSFPFDTIKIDRSFVSDLKKMDESAGIIRGIITLAGNLSMNVTAEGVETEGQFKLLRDAGCNEIQGYLISKPLPAPAILEFIARRVAEEASAQTALTPHLAW
jgi:diguanylate cyclase (GGDEF)-like protein